MSQQHPAGSYSPRGHGSKCHPGLFTALAITQGSASLKRLHPNGCNKLWQREQTLGWEQGNRDLEGSCAIFSKEKKK